MHQSTTPSLSQTIWPRWASRQFLTVPIVQTLLDVTFGYSLSSEAVVMRQLRRWKRLWRRSLTRSHKRTSMGTSRSCWSGTTSALQPEDITSKGTRVSSVYYQQKCPYEKSLETYLMILVYIGKVSKILSVSDHRKNEAPPHLADLYNHAKNPKNCQPGKINWTFDKHFGINQHAVMCLSYLFILFNFFYFTLVVVVIIIISSSSKYYLSSWSRNCL